MITILHNVRSQHNVGSIFRTSDAVGVEKLYLCGITPAPIDKYGRPNTKMLKVSLGAENSVGWESVKSTTHLVDRLKKQGYFIVAVELAPRAVPYFVIKRTKKQAEKTAIIMGGEVKGLSPAILKRADIIAQIPMCGTKESLNVSVAYGIIAYHLQIRNFMI
ncbi:MAG: TrmH family RNA methyltransferase [Candidatus Peregrinibacteria bacterium]|nr:TrmH family RNA methyltransferase [Candidatus Peregrinibacteria bacterium]